MKTRRCQLTDIARVFNGKTPSKGEQRSKGFPVLKIRDVTEHGQFAGHFESWVDDDFAMKFPDKLICMGDTLILNAAHTASYVGSKIYFAEPSVAGSLPTGEWLLVRPIEQSADPRFIHYWLKTAQTTGRIRDLVKGIHLYPKDVARLLISLPPLPEQQRIAGILAKADCLRRLRRYALQLSDTYLQSVFLAMFGDPVTNPHEWNVRPLGEAIEGFEGGVNYPPVSEGEEASAWRVLKVSAVTWGDFDPTESKPIHRTVAFDSNIAVRKGDLLMSRANTTLLVGAVCMVREAPPKVLLPDKLWRVRFSAESDLLPDYTMYALRQHGLRRRIGVLATGTSGSMKNISKAKAATLPVPRAPLAQQNQFAGTVQKYERLRAQQREAQRQAEHLFQTLLHQAFQGKL